ncbi:MAG: ABC-2 transporter permease [Candidatus Eisenbacteria bacterium]|nr:ABC-2 transporter permease [Candidatus Eisenbacteria bacterium]MCC7140809.1 ABC-2 transporter permease [Candidatus Eisenbacteria bacterium]
MIRQLVQKDLRVHRGFLLINAGILTLGLVLSIIPSNVTRSMGFSAITAQTISMMIWPVFPLIIQEHDRRTAQFLHSLPIAKRDLVLAKFCALAMLGLTPPIIGALVVTLGPLAAEFPGSLHRPILLILGALLVAVAGQGGLAIVSGSSKAIGVGFLACMMTLFVLTNLLPAGAAPRLAAELQRVLGSDLATVGFLGIELAIAAGIVTVATRLYTAKRSFV